MKQRWRIGLKIVAALGGATLAAAIVAPLLDAGPYGQRLQLSIERALGRHVELGKVHFSLWRGPRFSVNSVTIYEDPAIGPEPVV